MTGSISETALIKRRVRSGIENLLLITPHLIIMRFISTLGITLLGTLAAAFDTLSTSTSNAAAPNPLLLQGKLSGMVGIENALCTCSCKATEGDAIKVIAGFDGDCGSTGKSLHFSNALPTAPVAVPGPSALAKPNAAPPSSAIVAQPTSLNVAAPAPVSTSTKPGIGPSIPSTSSSPTTTPLIVPIQTQRQPSQAPISEKTKQNEQQAKAAQHGSKLGQPQSQITAATVVTEKK